VTLILVLEDFGAMQKNTQWITAAKTPEKVNAKVINIGIKIYTHKFIQRKRGRSVWIS
jgi:hypothetical protein